MKRSQSMRQTARRRALGAPCSSLSLCPRCGPIMHACFLKLKAAPGSQLYRSPDEHGGLPVRVILPGMECQGPLLKIAPGWALEGKAECGVVWLIFFRCLDGNYRLLVLGWVAPPLVCISS